MKSISFFMYFLFSFSEQAALAFSFILVVPLFIFLASQVFHTDIWTNISLSPFGLGFPIKILICQKMPNFVKLPHFSIWNKIVFFLDIPLNIFKLWLSPSFSFIFLTEWCSSKCLRFWNSSESKSPPYFSILSIFKKIKIDLINLPDLKIFSLLKSS